MFVPGGALIPDSGVFNSLPKIDCFKPLDNSGLSKNSKRNSWKERNKLVYQLFFS
jgi:hypothetical protein